MKKIKTKILIVCTLVFLLFLIPSEVKVRATTDGIRSGQVTIMVNDRIFETGGFSTDGGRLYICLFDFAYMFNGTSAQFSIQTPIDNRWDFWIVRGGNYTPTGTEFQYLEEEWRGLPSGYAGTDIVNQLEQTIIMGVDGENEPLISLVVNTIQNENNVYFELRDLAAILGLDFITFFGHFIDCTIHERVYFEPCSCVPDYPTWITARIFTETRLPSSLLVQPVELTRILRRISGLWVDREHFFSPTVDERSVWPAELRITSNGVNIPIRDSVAPMRPQLSWHLWEWENQWFYPVSMQTLENGLVEITVIQPENALHTWNAFSWWGFSPEDFVDFQNQPPQFYNHRFIIDPNQEEINSFTLYIGDTPHTMHRRGNIFEEFPEFRYQVLPANYNNDENEGGIILRYLFGSWSLSNQDEREFRIYRSFAPIEHDTLRRVPHSDFLNIENTMELLFSTNEIDPTDRIVFEFIDNTAQPGNIYYYTLWSMNTGSYWRTGEAHHSNMWSIRVDVNEILGITEPEPEIIEPIESPAPQQTPEPVESPQPTPFNPPDLPESQRGVQWIPIVMGVVGVFSLVFFILFVNWARKHKP